MAKRSLLLVDSDVRSLRVLEVSLRKGGFNVTTAESGKDALEKVATAQPDLIIADTELRELSGFELLEAIKADPKQREIPVIFLTGQTGIEHKIRGLELGVEDYLTKPIYIKEILTRIRILLQKRDRLGLEESEGSRTRFSGQLVDMGVVDLIQTIEVSRKSGLIHFTGEGTRRATIYFRKGKVIDAEAGPLQGADAVYRLLTWSDGKFEVLFRNVRRKDAVELSTQALLMEGMRRLDEWGRLLEQLPSLDTRFEIDYDELSERLSELPDELNSILRLFDGHRSLMEVLDNAGMGDLDALEVVSKLYFEGIIVESAADELSERPPSGSRAQAPGRALPAEDAIAAAIANTEPVTGDPIAAAISAATPLAPAEPTEARADKGVGLARIALRKAEAPRATADEDAAPEKNGVSDGHAKNGVNGKNGVHDRAAATIDIDQEDGELEISVTAADFADSDPTPLPPPEPISNDSGSVPAINDQDGASRGVVSSLGAESATASGEFAIPIRPRAGTDTARKIVTISPGETVDDEEDDAAEPGRLQNGHHKKARTLPPPPPPPKAAATAAQKTRSQKITANVTATAKAREGRGRNWLVLVALIGIPAAVGVLIYLALTEPGRQGTPGDDTDPDPAILTPPPDTTAAATQAVQPEIEPAPPAPTSAETATDDKGPAPDDNAAATDDNATTTDEPSETATAPAEDPEAQFEALYREARQKKNRGQSKAALEAIDAALAIEPLSAKALTLKSDILYMRSRFREALRYADAAVAERRRYAPGWLSKGLSHLELGEPAEAKEALTRYLELRPNAYNARDVRLLIEGL